MTPRQAGVLYWTESITPSGLVTLSDPTLNLVPFEGLNHMLNVTLKGATPAPAWYIGLFEGDFTPNHGITAAQLPGLATECTAYSASTRVQFQPGPVANGSVNNSAALAEFTFTSNKTVRGAFISSAPAKGATTGVLLSVVRFPSPKVQETGSILRVFAGPTASSAV